MRFPYETDRAARKTVGLLILSSDETAEQDLSRMLRGGSAMVHTARVANDPEITSDTLAAMAQTIPAAAASLPGISYDAIGYACTSGTSVKACASAGTSRPLPRRPQPTIRRPS